MTEMDDHALLRYSRHLLLPEIDIEGQEAFRAARVLIIGLGGLGAPASLYLAAAGIGTLVLADGDTVDLTNLQRQVVHTTAALGVFKAESARQTLLALHPGLNIEAVPERLEGARLNHEVALADVVLDCSDNFQTRHAVNRACVAERTPLVSGAAVRFEGQLTTFDLRMPTGPCYHCLFPESAEPAEQACATFGVFAPLTGLIGTAQAAEALKLVAHFGEPLVGRLWLWDALSMSHRTLRFQKDPACPVCGEGLRAGARKEST
jgi:molybdopterin-synthase adenylyltransferase